MRQRLLIGSALVVLVTSSPAHADGPSATPPTRVEEPAQAWSEGGWYAGEGFGQTSVSGAGARFFHGDLFAVRAFVGRRHGRWAVDAYAEAALLSGAGPLGDRGDIYSVGTFGLSTRYLFPVTDHITTYLRGGLSRMTIGGGPIWGEGDPSDRYSGRSIDYGVGIQLQGKVRALGLLYWPLFFTKWGPRVSASVWFDLTDRFARLRHPIGPTIDITTRTWTLGFSLGGGF